MTIAFLTGYFAFLPASVIGASGVLAVVTAGVYMGWHTPELTTVETRLQGAGFWTIFSFALNALLFGLVGLQLQPILDSLHGFSWQELVGYAALVWAIVFLIRLVYGYPIAYIPRWISASLRERDPAPPWQFVTFIAWAGMRGGVTLAAALAMPLETDAGAPFPDRSLIIFLAFSVVLATLVLQGLSLPAVVRILGLEEDDGDAREEAKARIHAAEAATARLDGARGRGLGAGRTPPSVPAASTTSASTRFRARLDDEDDGEIEERSLAYQRLRRELLDAERGAVHRASQRGKDQRGRDAARPARPRPRGLAARRVVTV